MCRLYGFRANEPTKVECTLVHAQNALLAQSRIDRRGESHPDGWGLATFDDGTPRIERRTTAAYADLHFSTTAERVFTRTVVAHVRRATVGALRQENTHPFAHAGWVFAHNGTIRAMESVGPVLLEETPDDLRAQRRGETDSELAFLWLLGRLRAEGVAAGAAEPGALAAVLRAAVARIDALCVQARAEKPARLNLLLTDGTVLAATRWQHELVYVQRHGVHDCEICGIPHVEHEPGADYRAVVVASEPISHEDWREVPEGAVLVVDGALGTSLHGG